MLLFLTTSHFPLPTSHFPLPTSHFPLPPPPFFLFYSQAEFTSAQKRAFVTSGDSANQAETASREQKVYNHAQHAANLAEASCGTYDDIMFDLNKLNEFEVGRKRTAALVSKKTERRAVRKLEKRQEDRAREYKGKVERSERKSERQVDVARSLHKTAADRVRTTTKVAEDSKALLERARLVDHENRIQAALELKANTDAASAAMRGKNERNAKKQELKDSAHRKEFDSILKMGGNPYIEFKKRDVQREALAKEKREKVSEKRGAGGGGLRKAEGESTITSLNNNPYYIHYKLKLLCAGSDQEAGGAAGGEDRQGGRL